MANIEARSENTYRIVVSDGYDGNGKKLRKYKTVTLPEDMTERQREKELNKLAVLFEKEVEDGTYLDGSKMTFSALAQKWLKEYAEKQLSPSTLEPYRMRLNSRVLPAIGHIKLAKLQPHHLLEFYNILREDNIRLDVHHTPTKALLTRFEGMTTPEIVKLSGVTFKTAQRIRNGGSTNRTTANKICAALNADVDKMFTCDSEKKLSEKTIRLHHGLISTILSTAVNWNLINSNPAERVKFSKMPKYKPDYYDEQQVAALLSALADEPIRYKTMIYLTIDTGMRTGEITGLKWSDVDFDNGTVTVNRQRRYVKGQGVYVCEPKTDNGFRTITLSTTAESMLRQYKNRQIEDFFKLGIGWNADRYVFLHEDGTPLYPHRPYTWFTEFLKRHNLPKITYHQLRHTNASLLISAGVDVVTLSGRLGHGDKNITLNTYSHVIKSKEAQAANRMEIFYSKASKRA